MVCINYGLWAVIDKASTADSRNVNEWFCIGEFTDKLGINTPPKNLSWPCDTIQDYQPAPAHCCLWVTETFAPLDSLSNPVSTEFFFSQGEKGK